jgi:hypothetical protein
MLIAYGYAGVRMKERFKYHQARLNRQVKVTAKLRVAMVRHVDRAGGVSGNKRPSILGGL